VTDFTSYPLGVGAPCGSKTSPASHKSKKSSKSTVVTACYRGMKKSDAVAKRSEGGRILGKRELKGIRKNNVRLEEYFAALSGAINRDAFEEMMESNAWLLARVTRQLGAGRVEVVTQNGSKEKVVISGSLKVKGKAAHKTDCEFVMLVNDVVLLHGPQIAAKLHHDEYALVTKEFARLSIVVPVKGFFTEGSIDLDTELEDMGFVWESSLPAGGAGEEEDEKDIDVDRV